MIKRLFTFILVVSSLMAQAQYRCQEIRNMGRMSAPPSINNNGKSDTIDILHYDIVLDMLNITSKQISGHCDIRYTPKINGVNSMQLDLLELQIDSIVQNGQALTYQYNDTIIAVNLGTTLNTTDTAVIEVYYHGSPQGDGSGWGGFHAQSGYYYNLGVGFAADPHTYGRAWFPCFDNFVEKSTYEFHITTERPLLPFCNGELISETVIQGDTSLFHWEMTDPIPTYLASIAISNYQVLQDTVNGLQKVHPIMLMAKAGDTSNLKASFIHLKQTLHAFEHYFGPYYWQKIGYAMTTVGAMEHATSIHFPIGLVDGSLGGEDIMAHELAHHWWGNLVTCETDADMWINEGMAEYCSHLYTEWVYGKERYLEEVMNNAYQVLELAHVRDNGYKAIYGLDHEYVYGFHVYQKGAMVAHNLRAYMSDNHFFNNLEDVMVLNKYGTLNSIQLRDQAAAISGVPLHDFFDNWVFNPGFPQVAVDSLHIDSVGNDYIAHVKVGQRIREAPVLFTEMPVYVSLFSETGDTIIKRFFVSGNWDTATFDQLPFKPVFAIANHSGDMLTGDTYDDIILDQPKLYAPRRSKMRINVNTLADTARLIVMHHWAGPGGKVAPGHNYATSSSRYYTVQGLDLGQSDLSARINYNGQTFDADLAGVTEDSLVILYRANPWDPWELYPHQQKTDLGSSTNGLGYFDLDQLKVGDYVMANASGKISTPETPLEKGKIDVYPNPTDGRVKVRFSNWGGNAEVKITNMKGQLVYSNTFRVNGSQDLLDLDLSPYGSGNLILNINGQAFPISLTK